VLLRKYLKRLYVRLQAEWLSVKNMFRKRYKRFTKSLGANWHSEQKFSTEAQKKNVADLTF
jgi:hypothetical protein